MITKYLLGITFSSAVAFLPQATAATSPPVSLVCDAAKNYDKDNFILSVGNRLLAKPEFNYYWGISSEDRKYLSELQLLLKKYKINIIAVPIPYQAALYINNTNNPAVGRYDPKQANISYQNQIRNLNDHGIIAIDLSAVAKGMPIGTDFFANRDHHWTGAGMEAVAIEVKSVVDKLNLSIDRTAQVNLSKTSKDYNGSVADELQRLCGYKYPKQEQRDFYDLSIKSSESLLGGTNNDVVMVGDSFSISYFGFDKIVSNQLKTPVLNVSINGGGCCASINGYFSRLKPNDAKPKLLIWTALMVLTNANQSRELKPSIYQAYENISPIKETSGKNTKMGNFQFNSDLSKTSRYFIKIKVDGPKTENMSFDFNYKSENEKISLYRKDENQSPTYSTSYFYELKPGQDFLKNVSLDPKQTGTVTVSLFKYN